MKGEDLHGGEILSKEEYPELYAAICSSYRFVPEKFTLPDLRGRFMRGWTEDFSDGGGI
jgi:hypothetical protein